MSSRMGRTGVVHIERDPKLLQQIQAESQKLSKLKDLQAIEAELVGATAQLQKARLEAQGILRQAEEDAIKVRHAADLEAKEIHQKAKAYLAESYAAAEQVRQTLEKERILLQDSQQELTKRQLEYGRDVQILERENQLLHGQKENLKSREVRLEASLRNLQTDLEQLTARERKIKELEAKTIATLGIAEEKSRVVSGLEGSIDHIRAEARAELVQANHRSVEAQDKWNRAELQEKRLREAETAFEAQVREFEERERAFASREAKVREREGDCLLREAQTEALRIQVEKQRKGH